MANKIILEIPPGLKPWEANNWRKIAAAINISVETSNAVNSTTSGISANAGKVKIDDGDSTANYLQEKLIAGTGIALTESLTGGSGSKILTAAIGAHADLTNMPDTGGTNTDHDARYVTQVSASAPTVPTPYEGMRWYDSDAPDDTSIYDNIVTFGGEVVVHEGGVVYL